MENPEKLRKSLVNSDFELEKKGKLGCLLGKPRNPKKRIQITFLITFYAFLRAFNLFLIFTNKNYAKIT